MMDVVAGRAEFSMSSLTRSVEPIKVGSLTALGVTSARRNALIPSVPAMSEAYPGDESVIRWGISVPAKTPQAIIDRLHDTLNVGMESEASTQGAERLRLSVAEPDAFVSGETRKWAGIAQRAGIKRQ